MKNQLTLILSVFFLIQFAKAQQVISSAGTTTEIPGYEVSWTIGEPVISTFTNATNTLTQGFHQSKLIVSAIEGNMFSGLKLVVYPNPAKDILYIKSEGISDWNFSYMLFDIDSRLLLQGKMEINPQSVDMISYPSGSYLLKVIAADNINQVQLFKIIKLSEK